MISYIKALRILKSKKINIQSEYILSKNSVNRISSKNVYANTNFPSANNSSFDGYAINYLDTIKLTKNNSQKFKILKTIAAGDNPKINKIKKFSAVEVMTGAIITKQFNTIIPVEAVKLFQLKKNERFIILNKKYKKNQFIRYKGSDYKKGDIVLKKGEIINSSHILALKTLGIRKVYVKKKPKIVFYTTGNEISSKINIPNWKIRSSNNFYLKSYLKNFPVKFVEKKNLRDKDIYLFKKQIKKNLNANTDLIITSGGVSAGKHDFIPDVIKKFKFKSMFRGVLIRPGKPVMFANFNNKTSFFGLPGNPISTVACFRFFVQPYLFSCLEIKMNDKIEASLEGKFSKKLKFTRFLKGKLFKSKNIFKFKILPGQESYRINSFVKSNSWGIFPNGKSLFKKGYKVKCTGLSIFGSININ